MVSGEILQKERFKSAIRNASLIIGLMTTVFLLEVLLDQNWYQLGVMPGKLVGLPGLVTSPFKHNDLPHLFNNSLLLLILLMGYFLHFPSRNPFIKLLLISVICNFWLWIIGREAWHYGASGLVYGVFFFLLYVSIFHRRRELFVYVLASLMLSVGFFVGLFPTDPQISFESHILGALAGLLVAFFEKKRKFPRKTTNNVSFTGGKEYIYNFKEQKSESDK